MTEATAPHHTWFAVRCVIHHADLGVYEERLTLWQAPTAEAAIGLAEDDVLDYARDLDAASYAGLAQAYELFDEPDHGAEVFSLMRKSALPRHEYLTAFFDTGAERQRDWRA